MRHQYIIQKINIFYKIGSSIEEHNFDVIIKNNFYHLGIVKYYKKLKRRLYCVYN